jgi:uncharacterized peroxidase-related enzyme
MVVSDVYLKDRPMNAFTLHRAETAEEPTANMLQSVIEQVGFLPNVFAVSAGAPPALVAFMALNEQFAQTSFSDLEREIIHTATSVENAAPYCVAGHTAFADMLDLDENAIQAVRGADQVEDLKLEALQTFTRQVVDQRGKVSSGELAAFLAAGYSQDQVIEAILGITVKIFTNFTSKITGIPLDDAFSPYVWAPHSDKQDAA